MDIIIKKNLDFFKENGNKFLDDLFNDYILKDYWFHRQFITEHCDGFICTICQCYHWLPYMNRKKTKPKSILNAKISVVVGHLQNSSHRKLVNELEKKMYGKVLSGSVKINCSALIENFSLQINPDEKLTGVQSEAVKDNYNQAEKKFVSECSVKNSTASVNSNINFCE